MGLGFPRDAGRYEAAYFLSLGRRSCYGMGELGMGPYRPRMCRDCGVPLNDNSDRSRQSHNSSGLMIKPVGLGFPQGSERYGPGRTQFYSPGYWSCRGMRPYRSRRSWSLLLERQLISDRRVGVFHSVRSGAQPREPQPTSLRVSGVGVFTPSAALLTRGNSVFVPGLLKL